MTVEPLAERSFVVHGLGVTGRAVTSALARRSFEVIVGDDAPSPAARALAADLGIPILDSAGVVDALARADAFLPTPGLPEEHVTMHAARAGGVAVHPDASATHTLHLSSHIVASHRVGARGLVVFAKDYSGGKLIDFEVVDVVSPNSADISFGLFGGFLYGTVTINHATGQLSGQVTGGSGAYQGDTGTITGHALRNGATLTLTYHH